MTNAADITLLVLDVDGVLTDGSIHLDDEGRETKRFCVRDGFGLSLWRRMGFGVAFLTGRSGKALLHRAGELGIEHVIQGAADKGSGLDQLISRCGIGPERMAYLGDDWPDLAVMRRVAYPMAVANAEERVRAAAAFVTSRPGGDGAAREAVEHLLSLKGLSAQAAALYDPL